MSPESAHSFPIDKSSRCSEQVQLVSAGRQKANESLATASVGIKISALSPPLSLSVWPKT